MPKPLGAERKTKMLAAVQYAGIQRASWNCMAWTNASGRIQTHITGAVPGLAPEKRPFLVYDLEIEDRMEKTSPTPRVHPLWFRGKPTTPRTETTIQLPAGTPPPFPRLRHAKTDGIRFKRTCKLKGNTFTVIEDRWLTTRATPATEYARLQFPPRAQGRSEDSLILRAVVRQVAPSVDHWPCAGLSCPSAPLAGSSLDISQRWATKPFARRLRPCRVLSAAAHRSHKALWQPKLAPPLKVRACSRYSRSKPKACFSTGPAKRG